MWNYQTIEAAFGLAQDRPRDGWLKLLLQQPLMRGRVVELKEPPVGLLKRDRCAA
jgi:hypothetical protein